jgi:hypothetical protein
MRRLIVAVLVGSFVLWVAASALSAFAAKGHLEEAQSLLRDLKGSPMLDLALEEDGIERIRAAQGEFREAHRLVSSPILFPARFVPILGRQLRSVIALSKAGEEVLDAGADALGELGDALGAAPSSGGERVELVRRIAELAERTSERLNGVELGPSAALFASLGAARHAFAAELDAVQEATRKAVLIGRGLEGFLEGPRTYLLVATNNAEMRAGSGTFLNVVELRVSNGSLEVGESVPSWTLSVPPGAVALDGDMEARWGWLEPNREWLNLAATPRFDETAPLAARMWQASQGKRVDGVLAADLASLRALLEVTGPVELEGEVLDASNVLREMMHDQYVGVSTSLDHRERRERQGGVTKQVVEALDRGGWEVSVLLKELATINSGRHFLAWSGLESDQKIWEATGIDGTLTPDSLMLAVINRGASKLDQHLRVMASLDYESSRGQVDAALRITIRNEVPEGEIPYVIGPYRTIGVEEGTYNGILSVNLPGNARDVHFDGHTSLAVAGADGPTIVVGLSIEVARNAQRSFVLRFRIPEGEVRVEPSARIPPVEWRSGGEAWVDRKPRILDLFSDGRPD